jgi:hypothetical protein
MNVCVVIPVALVMLLRNSGPFEIIFYNDVCFLLRIFPSF